jgi:hypothetical protein
MVIGGDRMADEKKILECAECGDTGISLEAAGKLWVKDRFIDVIGMDDIFEGVIRMRLKDRNRIAEELMASFILNNEMIAGMEQDYRLALIDEYERRQAPYL